MDTGYLFLVGYILIGALSYLFMYKNFEAKWKRDWGSLRKSQVFTPGLYIYFGVCALIWPAGVPGFMVGRMIGDMLTYRRY